MKNFGVITAIICMWSVLFSSLVYADDATVMLKQECLDRCSDEQEEADADCEENFPVLTVSGSANPDFINCMQASLQGWRNCADNCNNIFDDVLTPGERNCFEQYPCPTTCPNCKDTGGLQLSEDQYKKFLLKLESLKNTTLVKNLREILNLSYRCHVYKAYEFFKKIGK